MKASFFASSFSFSFPSSSSTSKLAFILAGGHHFYDSFLAVFLFLLSSLGPSSYSNGIQIFHNQRDSAVYTKGQIEVNCSESICVGPFRDIYCQGPIIWAAWHFGLQAECPGTKMRFDSRTILRNFDRSFEQGKLRKEAFVRFCEENFDARPYLEEAHLADWKLAPKLLGSVRDKRMRLFATEMHKIWPQLARRFVEDVHQAQEHYPLLPVPNPFIIPGNLVQMYYYFDTYWIFKGLLLSELFDTAKGMLRNFGHLMKGRGHIPNSGFIKHQRRSQPPLFPQMVVDYYELTEDREFLEEILPSVERELEWWRKNRTVQVRLGKEEYTAYIYRVKANCPRPEQFMLDYYYAFESGRDDLEYIWSSIISAVESGMDFSTRWFSMESDDDEMAFTRKGIRTNDIVPVDLNVFMALNYRAVSRFYAEFGNLRKQKFYQILADSLSETIEAIFRDGPNAFQMPSVWFDFDLVKGHLRRHYFPTNIFPLLLFSDKVKGTRKWADDCGAAINFLKESGALNFKGGIPTSMTKGSVERWDFPNGEPRIIHFTVLALLKCSAVNPEAWTIAKRIADGLLLTAFNGLFHPRRGMPAQIWEKYDVRFEDGRSGFGGDYIPQVGFGSTNGALLDLIRIFYTNSTEEKPKRGWTIGAIERREKDSK